MKNTLLEEMYTLNLLGMNHQLPPVEQKVFETYAGSVARGVAKEGSDVDVVAVFVPDYEQLYPFKVPGFGTQPDVVKTVQVPDLSVRIEGTGSVNVDVQAMGVVHYFNMLLKGSPNHVEYLFFNADVQRASKAGRLMVKHRDMFVTQSLVSRYSKAGCALLNHDRATNKQYALAVRFFSYAHQAVNLLTLKPHLVTDLNSSMLYEYSNEDCRSLAYVIKEVSMDAEMMATHLPLEVDEEVANKLLLSVLRTHWESQSGG